MGYALEMSEETVDCTVKFLLKSKKNEFSCPYPSLKTYLLDRASYVWVPEIKKPLAMASSLSINRQSS